MGSRITWRGDKELAAALHKKAQMSAVKNVVKKSGAQMSDLTKTFMQPTGGVYSKGYARGNNQKSTNVEIVDNGMTAKQTTNTDHIGFNMGQGLCKQNLLLNQLLIERKLISRMI